MNDKDKTKEQLIEELEAIRRQIAGLERSEAEHKKAKKSMELAASEWRATFDSISDPVSIHDRNFKIVRMNKAAANALNTDLKKLLGKNCYQVFHGRETPSPDCPHLRVLETGKQSTAEFFEPQLGVHLEASASPIFDDNGQVTGSVHITKDITERKRAEEVIRQSNEFGKTILNSTNDAISVINVCDYTVATANVVFLKQIGLKEEEVIGRHCYELTHKRSTPCEGPYDLCPLIETLSGGGHAEAEHIHLGADGQRIYAEVSTSPIRDEKGEIVQVVHVSKNITKRKLVEEALREKEAQYSSLFDHSPNPLYEEDWSAIKAHMDALRSSGVKDFRQYFDLHPEDVASCLSLIKIIKLNQAASKISFLKETIETKNAVAAGMHRRPFHQILSGGFKEILIDIAEGKTVTEKEMAFRTSQGNDVYRIFKLSIAPGYEETLQRVFASATDITERKRAEEELRKSEAMYATLFEHSPNPLWEEDWSAVKAYIDNLRASGVKDLRKHLDNHPEDMAHCFSLIKIVKSNKVAVGSYSSVNARRFIAENTGRFFSPETWENLKGSLVDIIEGKPVIEREMTHKTLDGDGETHGIFKLSVAPGSEETLQRIFVSSTDITALKQAEKERERLILQLKESLAQIKTLKGLVPICSSCKKIRDDKGYWNGLETYIEKHSDAEFSHGICPDCMKKLYPAYADKEK